MAVVNPFINILRTKQEALYFKNKTRNLFFKGVQLLPNNPRVHTSYKHAFRDRLRRLAS
jgi:hypothetical protein